MSNREGSELEFAAVNMMRAEDWPLVKLLNPTIGSQWRSSYMNREWSDKARAGDDTNDEDDTSLKQNPFTNPKSQEELIDGIDRRCQSFERKAYASLFDDGRGGRDIFLCLFGDINTNENLLRPVKQRLRQEALTLIVFDRVKWATEDLLDGEKTRRSIEPQKIPLQTNYTSYRPPTKQAKTLFESVSRWREKLYFFSMNHESFMRGTSTTLASSTSCKKAQLKDANPALTSLLAAESVSKENQYRYRVQRNFARAALGIIVLSQSHTPEKYLPILKHIAARMAMQNKVSRMLELDIFKENETEAGVVTTVFLCAVFSPIILFYDTDLTETATKKISITDLHKNINLPIYNDEKERFIVERGSWRLILAMASRGIDEYTPTLQYEVSDWLRNGCFKTQDNMKEPSEFKVEWEKAFHMTLEDDILYADFIQEVGLSVQRALGADIGETIVGADVPEKERALKDSREGDAGLDGNYKKDIRAGTQDTLFSKLENSEGDVVRDVKLEDAHEDVEMNGQDMAFFISSEENIGNDIDQKDEREDFDMGDKDSAILGYATSQGKAKRHSHNRDSDGDIPMQGEFKDLKDVMRAFDLEKEIIIAGGGDDAPNRLILLLEDLISSLRMIKSRHI